MSQKEAKPRRWRREVIRLVLGLVVLSLIAVGLFVGNGLWPGWKTPDQGTTAVDATTTLPKRLVILNYNIAKCFSHEGGINFRDTAEIEDCLSDMAALIRLQEPDLVFLTEINKECGPCPVDQVRFLAEATKMHSWAFAENYSWGLPFYRIRSGNALLSRFPLRGLKTQELAGDAPFWNPMGRRRVLWVELLVGSAPLLVGSLRNDSFDYEKNAHHVEQILEHIGDRPAILGGDFNAPPESDSMKRFRSSGQFSGSFDGPATYPSNEPERCIDYVLAPAAWKLLEHTVIDSELSDHRPMVSVFETTP